MSPIALFALHADHSTMLSSVSASKPSAAPNIRGTQPEYGVLAPSENVYTTRIAVMTNVGQTSTICSATGGRIHQPVDVMLYFPGVLSQMGFPVVREQ